jgi:quercetin dioxygenase-like cupin family protein
MNLIRREFLYLSGIATLVPAMSQAVLAQVQQAGPKLVQILRKDLEGQGQQVQETIVSAADFAPGSTSPWHMHPGAQEVLLVREGALTVEIDGQGTRVIKAGDGGIIPAEVAHLARNESASVGAKAFVVHSRSAKDKPLLVVVKR